MVHGRAAASTGKIFPHFLHQAENPRVRMFAHLRPGNGPRIVQDDVTAPPPRLGGALRGSSAFLCMACGRGPVRIGDRCGWWQAGRSGRDKHTCPAPRKRSADCEHGRTGCGTAEDPAGSGAAPAGGIERRGPRGRANPDGAGGGRQRVQAYEERHHAPALYLGGRVALWDADGADLNADENPSSRGRTMTDENDPSRTGTITTASKQMPQSHYNPDDNLPHDRQFRVPFTHSRRHSLMNW